MVNVVSPFTAISVINSY